MVGEESGNKSLAARKPYMAGEEGTPVSELGV